MPDFQSLPGFRDFYPAEFAVRAHVVATWRETARRYAFEEYDGPPLEPLELRAKFVVCRQGVPLGAGG